MKTALAILLAAVCIGVYADDPAPQQGGIVATTLFSDGSTNAWTQADLVAALQLINRKYHRDCLSGNGRKAWHGNMREAVATNEVGELVKTEIHEDGQTFTFTSRVVTASASVAASNSRLKTTMSRGIPAALAAARARREDEKATTNTVVITIEANR